MSTSAVQNPSPANGAESKSSRKKKAKEGGTNGATVSPAVPEVPAKDSSSHGDGDGTYEHPYIKELTKHIRNMHKKLAGYQKVDAIIAENPNTSLDDLVAQRKINNDQKSAALKKPQLQQQLAGFEEQISQYRKFDAEYQTLLQKQKDDLTAQHEKELEKVRGESRIDDVTAGAAELQEKLLTFSQFLRAAAAKRSVEEEKELPESRAFEGALLLVYGGDESAVEAALKLIEGVDEQVPGIDGVLLPVKYSQVKQLALDHAPFQAEETWVDSVAEANAEAPETEAGTDPTIAHAGLTELDTAGGPNGVSMGDGADTSTSPPQGDAGDATGNAAGERWDTTSGAEKGLMEDGNTMVPRPQDELETPNSAGLAGGAREQSLSWADEPPSYESTASGNLAGESWDVKAAGDQTDNTWAGADGTAQPTGDGWGDGAADSTTGATQEEGDGFHQVPGRHRGRGSRGRGGDGEFRGRGRGRGGFRGDGEFRGRGRGGFRGGRGGDGEFRGRGGGFRGRGFRSGAEGQIRGSAEGQTRGS